MKNEDFFRFLFDSAGLAGTFSDLIAPKWIKLLDAQLQPCQYRKGQLVLIAGDIPDQLFFLRKGALRAYTTGDDGLEYSFYLWAGPALATDVLSFIDQQPSDLNIEVYKDSILLSISRDTLNRVIAAHPEARFFFYLIVLIYFRYHRERDMDQLVFDTAGRLAKLKKDRREVTNMFRRDHIASFLGISRSWLFGFKSKKRGDQS